MVTADEYRHVPTGTLAILAQRLEKVFASPSTWYRLVRDHGWRRPRQRVHPARPKVGIRASRPNEVWHVDTTMVRLVDGTRAYLHAVIDNFSRRILAWKVSATFEPAATAEILSRAFDTIPSADRPTLLADGGVENFNDAVDELVETGRLRRLLAMTEITYSNSLIESWWRVLKHQWLYLNTLDSVAAVERLVAFYVTDHNEKLPHSALRGQTPAEMYFGKGRAVPAQLERRRTGAGSAGSESPRLRRRGSRAGPRGQIGRIPRLFVGIHSPYTRTYLPSVSSSLSRSPSSFCLAAVIVNFIVHVIVPEVALGTSIEMDAPRAHSTDRRTPRSPRRVRSGCESCHSGGSDGTGCRTKARPD